MLEALGMRLIVALLAGDNVTAVETTLALLAILTADEVTLVSIEM